MIKTVLFIALLVVFGCEDEQDTTPPTVSIQSPITNNPIFEIVTIVVETNDNVGISKVEFYVDDSLVSTDTESPYEYDWNTTEYEDDSEHIVKVISYDTSDNSTPSQPISYLIDNSGSHPQSVSITSIVFGDGSFTITWNQSTDGDFSSYELEKSVESTMGDYDVIYTTEDATNTNYVDSDVDPLIYQYYRVTVSDTLNLETKGQILSSSLDPVPTFVYVTSVIYTLSAMTVEWEESSDGDFRDYKLLSSETEGGDKDTLETYTDKSTTSHIITDFDPTHENWFWVLVSDTLGQYSLGNGGTNQIDSPPTTSELYPIVYEDGSFTFTWSQNNNNDFQSYTLYESLSENMSGQTEIFTSENNTETSYTVTEVSEDEMRFYQIIIEDVWGLESLSNIEGIGDDGGDSDGEILIRNNTESILVINANNDLIENIMVYDGSTAMMSYLPGDSQYLYVLPAGDYHFSAIDAITNAIVADSVINIEVGELYQWSINDE